MIYEDWREWSDASREWSERRRSRSEAERRFERVLLALAVAGVALMIYYCTLSTPWYSWYIGLIGVVLTVPYLTRRIS